MSEVLILTSGDSKDYSPLRRLSTLGEDFEIIFVKKNSYDIFYNGFADLEDGENGMVLELGQKTGPLGAYSIFAFIPWGKALTHINLEKFPFLIASKNNFSFIKEFKENYHEIVRALKGLIEGDVERTEEFLENYLKIFSKKSKFTDSSTPYIVLADSRSGQIYQPKYFQNKLDEFIQSFNQPRSTSKYKVYTLLDTYKEEIYNLFFSDNEHLLRSLGMKPNKDILSPFVTAVRNIVQESDKDFLITKENVKDQLKSIYLPNKEVALYIFQEDETKNDNINFFILSKDKRKDLGYFLEKGLDFMKKTDEKLLRKENTIKFDIKHISKLLRLFLRQI